MKNLIDQLTPALLPIMEFHPALPAPIVVVDWPIETKTQSYFADAHCIGFIREIVEGLWELRQQEVSL